jgi:hypothetical protein
MATPAKTNANPNASPAPRSDGAGDPRLKRLPDPVEGQLGLAPLNALGALFKKRPIILGEAEADYDTLLARLTDTVRPRDVIAALMVKDLADLTWDAQRYRRMKASLLMNARASSLRALLPFFDTSVTLSWLAKDAATVATVDAALAQRGLDHDAIMAQALSDHLDEIDRLDRLTASAEARRARTLKELQRHCGADR